MGIPTPAVPRPGVISTPSLIGGLMTVEALTFGIASVVHLDVSVPLGFATIRGELFLAAAIPEAIIAGVLLAGAIAVLARPRGSWGVALTTTLFALTGVLLGLSALLSGPISRSGDVTYHSTIFIAFLGTIALLVTPAARRSMRRQPVRTG
jgi:hypothetical protein